MIVKSGCLMGRGRPTPLVSPWQARLEQLRLPDRVVAAGDPFLGQDNLPEVIFPGPEGAGAGQEIIFPHPIEPIAVFRPQRFPIGIKIFKPGHDGLAVVVAEAVPVFDDK